MQMKLEVQYTGSGVIRCDNDELLSESTHVLYSVWLARLAAFPLITLLHVALPLLDIHNAVERALSPRYED